MIIDAHTHIYPEFVAEKALRKVIGNTAGQLDAHTDGTFEGLLSSMDRAGVDYSLVLPIATDPRHGNGILQWLKEIIDRSDRLIFFGSVHPLDPEYRAVIRETKELGLKGLKLHPAYQGFPADGPDAYRIYEEAIRNDLILHFHAGRDPSMPGSDYTSVERFARVTSDFQGGKLILAHAGGCGEWDKVLDLMGDKGCYFDISFVLEDMMINRHARQLYFQNEDFFLFGTDSPWRDQRQYVDLIRNSASLTREQKEKLFSGNLLSLTGMELPVISSSLQLR